MRELCQLILTKSYPTLAPGVSVTASNRIINTKFEYAKAGGLSDSTINLAKVWFVGDGQSIGGAPDSWCAQSDLAIPRLPAETPDQPDYKARYDALCAEIVALAAKYKEE